MRSLTLLIAFLLFVSIKGRTIKTVLAKKDEAVDHNFQNDAMDSEMNGSSSEDAMMENDNEMTKSEENLGMHYFQGDVLTTDDQMAKLTKMLDSGSPTPDDQLHSRALVKDVRRTWTKKVVPYVIAKDVDKYRRGIIKSAIKHWEEKTCLRFKRRSNEKDYVQFEQKPGCSSYVGRIGGKQNLVVGNKKSGCRVGNIIHEIGHAVGFFHEQSRPDRNEFVKINWENVKNGYKVNFMKFSKRVIDSKDVVYDYGSIMHYPRKIFGKTPKNPTVIPKKKTDTVIGQRVALSKLDILQISKLYGCPVKPDKNNEDEDEMENTDNESNEMNTMP